MYGNCEVIPTGKMPEITVKFRTSFIICFDVCVCGDVCVYVPLRLCPPAVPFSHILRWYMFFGYVIYTIGGHGGAVKLDTQWLDIVRGSYKQSCADLREKGGCMPKVHMANLHKYIIMEGVKMVDQHFSTQSTFSSPFSTKLIASVHWSSVTSKGRRLTALQQEESTLIFHRWH